MPDIPAVSPAPVGGWVDDVTTVVVVVDGPGVVVGQEPRSSQVSIAIDVDVLELTGTVVTTDEVVVGSVTGTDVVISTEVRVRGTEVEVTTGTLDVVVVDDVVEEDVVVDVLVVVVGGWVVVVVVSVGMHGPR